MITHPGRLITFEGGEGLGKTTHIAAALAYLQQQNIPVIKTREPGGTAVAEKIRAVLLDKQQETLSLQTELLLMFAARSQHLEHVIKPALAKGQWVLCDRFTDATYAYQGGGRNMNIETIAWLETFVQGRLRPDLTLLFDAPVEVGMARIAQRGDPVDRFEIENLSFFENVRQMYLNRAQQYSARTRLIDANQPLLTVQQQVIDVIAQFVSVNQAAKE